MSAREQILAAVRAARSGMPDTGGPTGAVPGAGPAAPAEVPRPGGSDDAPHADGPHADGTHAVAPQKSVLDLFVERVEDYRASVTRLAQDDPLSIARVVRSILAQAAATRVVIPAGLDLDLAAPDEPAGHSGGAGSLQVVVDDGLDARELDAVDAVVTRCAVGIAQTGTIVLNHEADQGRRAITLVPDLHVCLVAATSVVADVPEAIERLAVDPGCPQTWISGPSATSDIELDRVEGVHGPRTLHVVLIDSRLGGHVSSQSAAGRN